MLHKAMQNRWSRIVLSVLGTFINCFGMNYFIVPVEVKLFKGLAVFVFAAKMIMVVVVSTVTIICHNYLTNALVLGTIYML